MAPCAVATHTVFGQDGAGGAGLSGDDSQQQVLGADVGVLELSGFVLGEGQDVSGARIEVLKHETHARTP